MSFLMIFALAAFAVIFIIISTEKINKTIVVVIAAGIFIILGIIDQETAFLEIDWNVIFLLIGMMIIVGITKKTGVFQYFAIKVAKIAKGNPITILVMLSALTAVLSALLDNVTTVLILTPVSILIAVELGLPPILFVISEAIASNIGGAATLIGDPPNIMIGSAADLGFMDFIVNLGPIVVINIIVLSVVVFIFFRKKMHVPRDRRARIMEFDETQAIKDKPLLIKSIIVVGMVILGFVFHGMLNLEPATIALFGAGVLMLLSGKKEVEELFHEVEWGTIFFFIGLFIIVGGLVKLGIIEIAAQFLLNSTNNDIPMTSYLMIWVSGLFSSFLDNIPYVATMIPLVKNLGATLGDAQVIPIWWSLAMGACFGGNGTLVGASANVVSAGICSKSGYKISFLEFTKYGSIATVITLITSTVYVYLVYLH
ncbi:MAG: ArsB/NhaD family transporter [Spirochaetales bacterium]|nr:ArsB/NhaD family transporter [Spirochaetales bacterium]